MKSTRKTAAPKASSRKVARPLTTEQIDARVMKLYRPWVAIEANDGEEQEDELTFSMGMNGARASIEKARLHLASSVRVAESFLRLAEHPFDAAKRRKALAIWQQVYDGEERLINEDVDGDLGMIAWMLQAIEDKGVHPNLEEVAAKQAARLLPPNPTDIIDDAEAALWHAQNDITRCANPYISGTGSRAHQPWTAAQKRVLVDTLLSVLGLPPLDPPPADEGMGDVVLVGDARRFYGTATREAAEADDSGRRPDDAEVLLRELDAAAATAIVNLQRIRDACRAPGTIEGATVLARVERAVRLDIHARGMNTLASYAKTVQGIVARELDRTVQRPGDGSLAAVAS